MAGPGDRHHKVMTLFNRNAGWRGRTSSFDLELLARQRLGTIDDAGDASELADRLKPGAQHTVSMADPRGVRNRLCE